MLAQRKQGEHSKAIFFITRQQWQQHHWSEIKIDLLLRHVDSLKHQLRAFNIELECIALATFKEQPKYLANYCQKKGINEIVANQEVEINEQHRDQACKSLGLNLTLFEADVIVPKGKVLNQSGEMFKVFTPFKRAWLSYVSQYGFDYLGKPEVTNENTTNQQSANANSDIQVSNSSKKWPLAITVEQQVFPRFLHEKIADYAEQRDIPSIKGTSGLSPYLAIGAISPRYLLRQLLNNYPDLLVANDSAKFSWLNELIWREFYRHLLHHQPRLCKHQCFNEKYQQCQWPNSPALFKQWCEGKTGYPLVDAAMRQLNTTGWMHNRLRMVVASFLTKHLLIDWRWGERYFMQQLIDGDLAANNGGWQWAASTGCDAQPYFRIFNPIRQSERFDPNGKFIRKYLPELNDIPNKHIHFPHKYLADNSSSEYWPAIVDHKEARAAALAFYK